MVTKITIGRPDSPAALKPWSTSSCHETPIVSEEWIMPVMATEQRAKGMNSRCRPFMERSQVAVLVRVKREKFTADGRGLKPGATKMNTTPQSQASLPSWTAAIHAVRGVLSECATLGVQADRVFRNAHSGFRGVAVAFEKKSVFYRSCLNTIS